MIKEARISLFDIVICFSDAVDLVSPVLANHHKQVAYIAFNIAKEMDLPEEEQNELALAGAMHDIGGLSLNVRERLNFMREIEDPHQHSATGYMLLKAFKPFSNLAPIVRYHHMPWNEGRGSEFNGKEVPMESHVLHLADRVAVLVNKEQEVLGQVKKICEAVKENSGKKFRPDLVDVFMALAQKEYFWLDVASSSVGSTLSGMLSKPTIQLDSDGLHNLAKLFAHVIDFRSKFTATHSLGVAASAELIAKFAGFSERECLMIKVAGYLHDLGKLAVPKEILEKPAKLTNDELNMMRHHPFHTYRILERLGELDTINAWGSFHHERLNGNGYPFHHKGHDLPIGSRIMAVADVFTAITEDRPYRKGMHSDKALQVMQDMATHSALDPDIVSLLGQHFDEMKIACMAGQENAARAYLEFSPGN